MAPSNDEQKPLSGFALWRKNSREGEGQILEIVKNTRKNYPGLKKSDQLIILSFGGFAAGSIALAGALFGPWAAIVQGIGFVANSTALINARLKLNHHKIAVQPGPSMLMAFQQVLLGGFGYAIMAGIAAVRPWIFSMIPEGSKYNKLKTGIALGFAGIGIAGITTLSIATGRLAHLMTIPSMLMGTVADRIPSSEDPKKDQTRFARLFRGLACANNTLYNVFVSGSAAGIFTDALATLNFRNAIRENDVPEKDENGQPLSRKESLSRYMTSLINREPPIGLTPKQIEDAEKTTKIKAEPVMAATMTPAPAPQPTMDHKLSELSATSAFKPTAAGDTSTTPAPAERPVTPPAPGPAPG